LSPELVERSLQGGVQLGVVECQSDLAGQLGENTIVLLAEADRAFARATTIVPRSSPAWQIGATRIGPTGRPFNKAGIQTEAQALPDTPA